MNRPFKPRPKSQGAYTLITIQKYSEEGYISTNILLQKMKLDYNIKITPKQLIVNLSNLSKAGYIEE